MSESLIQIMCYRYFLTKYPNHKGLLFHVPNGRKRTKWEGAKLKAEGVVAGVADFIFLQPNNEYHGLAIEIKTKTGRQQQTQKDWQNKIEKNGFKYAIVRSVKEFEILLSDYNK